MNNPLDEMKEDERLAIEAMQAAHRADDFELVDDCNVILEYLDLFLRKGQGSDIHVQKAQRAKALVPTFHSGVRFDAWWNKRLEMIEDAQEQARIYEDYQAHT